MNTFKPNKNSWHYRVLHWFHAGEWNMPRDFCSYWRHIVLLGVGAAFLAWVLASPIVVWFMGLPGSDELGLRMIPFLVFCAGVFVAVLGGLAWAVVEIQERFPRKHSEKPDGLLKTRYKAWKSKYCPMVGYD